MVRMALLGVVWRRRWRAALALLLIGALLAPLPLSWTGAADYPGHSPAALAHLLADYSNYHRLDPTIGAWWVEEESSNYTWWEYSVRYECGARCGGRAEMRAGALHAAGAPRHSSAPRHHLLLRERRCVTLPLLPWPSICKESEMEMEVSEREGGGSRLQLRTAGACGALAALALGCRLPDVPART